MKSPKSRSLDSEVHIPEHEFLSWEEELELAQQIERDRMEYRRLLLQSMPVQEYTLAQLKRVLAGDLHYTKGIYIRPESHWEMKNVQQALPAHVRTIEGLSCRLQRDQSVLFRESRQKEKIPAPSVTDTRRKIVALFEELSVDGGILEKGYKEKFVPLAERMQVLASKKNRNPAENEELKRLKEHLLCTSQEAQQWIRDTRAQFALLGQHRNELTQAHLLFSAWQAKKYKGRGLSYPDLIQEANVGMARAINKFDWRKNFRFKTYASWWMRQAITTALYRHRTERDPTKSKNRKARHIEEADQYLRASGNPHPTAEDIAEETGFAPEKIEIPKQIGIVSLHSRDAEAQIETFLADPVSEEETDLSSLPLVIESLLPTLPPGERDVLKMRFGLNGQSPKTLQEIGDRLGLTKEAVRQTEARGLQRLRHPSRRTKLEAFLD